MDAFILVFTLGIMLAIGVPVAYAVGISAIVGAWYIDIPLEAVMIQLTNGVNKFSLLAIPFFILAGAIMAEGGIARRLVNFAYIFVGFIRGGQSLENVKAIVEAAGLKVGDIVKTTVFVKDLNDFANVNATYEAFFTEHNATFPARSCVEVARLPKDVKIEIEAIAVRR